MDFNIKQMFKQNIYFIGYTIIYIFLSVFMLIIFTFLFKLQESPTYILMLIFILSPLIAYKKVFGKQNDKNTIDIKTENKTQNIDIKIETIDELIDKTTSNELTNLKLENKQYQYILENADKLLVSYYISFENTSNIHEAYFYLEKVNAILRLYQYLESVQLKLFPMPFNGKQAITKEKISYPDIVYLVNSALYVIANFDYISSLIKEPIKQVELIKILQTQRKDLNIQLIKDGLYFLGRYNFIKRWNMKNRVWFHYDK